MVGFLKEFMAFAKAHKKLWLLPIFMMLILLSALLVFTQGSAVATFVYTLF